MSIGKTTALGNRPASHVEEQLLCLENALVRLSIAEQKTREKLKCVLRVKSHCEREGECKITETLVPLADRIRAIKDSSIRISEGLEDIIDSLEL